MKNVKCASCGTSLEEDDEQTWIGELHDTPLCESCSLEQRGNDYDPAQTECEEESEARGEDNDTGEVNGRVEDKQRADGPENASVRGLGGFKTIAIQPMLTPEEIEAGIFWVWHKHSKQ